MPRESVAAIITAVTLFQLLSPLLHAGVMFAVVALLYAPVAWFERWAILPPGDRERFGSDPLLPLTTALKLLGKRASFPAGDVALHLMAPVLSLTPALFVLAALPTVMKITGADTTSPVPIVGAGIPWILVVGVFLVSPAGTLLAARAGKSPLEVLGAVRLAAVRTSTLVMLALGVGAVARALRVTDFEGIVAQQGTEIAFGFPAWGLFISPMGFFSTMFAVVVLLARATRGGLAARGELVESHQQMSAGPLVLAQRVFEVVDLMALSTLFATTFLGGATPPAALTSSLDGVALQTAATITLILKSLVVGFTVLVIRRVLPPLRHDQAMRILWLVIFPLSLLGFVLSSVLGAHS